MSSDRPDRIGLEDSVAGATLSTKIPLDSVRPDERDEPSVPSKNSRSNPPPGLIPIPGYTFIELLQKPDRTIVFKAKEEKSNRLVVLKQFAPEEREQFIREKGIQEILASSDSNKENILLADMFLDEYMTLVSQYLRGGHLDNVIAKTGMLHPRQTKITTFNLLDALHIIHDHGIVHRDIKGRNVLMDITNPDLQVENITAETLGSYLDFKLRLCDYELASHAAFPEQHKKGTFIGTPAYAAPEVCRGEKNDPRSDLYSVGVIFYRILTGGEYPVKGNGPKQIIQRQIMDSFPDITQLNRHITSGQKQVLEKLWAKNPKDRYQVARDFQYDWISEL